MHFSQLNMVAQSHIMTLYIVCFTLLLVTMLALIIISKDKKNVLPMASLLVFIVLETSAMEEMNRVYRKQMEVTQLVEILNNIPVWLLIACGIFVIPYCIYHCYKLFIYMKTALNPFSIKEAVENLPMGIAFETKEGSLLLSNRTFNRLSHLLTNKDMQNGEEFWNDLTTLQSTELCTVQGQEPVFTLSNGEVWKFSKISCTLDNLDCFQIKADNITDIYNLSQDLREVNAKLTQQQNTLKELFTNIEYNISEQVVFNMRVNFHDNFGNLTTLTKKSLDQDIGIEKTEELLNLWEGIVNSLDVHKKKIHEQELKLNQIENLAIKLGCELFIAGELPQEKKSNQLMLLAINEMLKNSVYHARAKKLFVSMKSNDTEYRLEIQNINTNKITKLKEGGGLSGLRKKIEQAKGSMNIDISENVTLVITLMRS